MWRLKEGSLVGWWSKNLIEVSLRLEGEKN
jgi:hypothetical protein